MGIRFLVVRIYCAVGVAPFYIPLHIPNIHIFTNLRKSGSQRRYTRNPMLLATRPLSARDHWAHTVDLPSSFQVRGARAGLALYSAAAHTSAHSRRCASRITEGCAWRHMPRRAVAPAAARLEPYRWVRCTAICSPPFCSIVHHGRRASTTHGGRASSRVLGLSRGPWRSS